MPKENDKPYNLKTIAASLKRQGLVAKAVRKFKATTNSKHNLPVFGNLRLQDFSATAPDQKWAGDITYLSTDEGWLYLAVIIDLFSRQVVGCSMAERMKADLLCCVTNGYLQAKTAQKRDRSLRSRQPILFARLSAITAKASVAGQHECQGQLLR